MALRQRLLAPIAAGFRSTRPQRQIGHSLAANVDADVGDKVPVAATIAVPSVMTAMKTRDSSRERCPMHMFKQASYTKPVLNDRLLADDKKTVSKRALSMAATIVPQMQVDDFASSQVTAEPPREKTIHDLPGPPCWPVIGNAMAYMKKKNKGRIHAMMAELHDKHGTMFKEKLGPLLQLHIRDADVVEQLLRHEGKYPDRPAFNAWKLYRRVAGESCGVITGSNEEWLHGRKALSKRLLPPKTVESYGPALCQVRGDFIDRIRYLRQTNGDEQLASNLGSELCKWSMESIGSILFEQRMGCLQQETPERVQKFVSAIVDMLASSLQLIIGEQLHRKYNTRFWQRHQAAWDSIFEIGKSYVDEKEAELAQACVNGDHIEIDRFLVHLLTNSNLSRSEVYANITELMLAGVDTSANTLGFVLHLLATHPEVQDKLYEEVTRVLNGNPATADVFQHMPYMKCVFRETLRLYPVVTMNVRVLQHDMTLGGYRIPSKTQCVINYFALGRDETYFKNAEQFTPERWHRGVSDKVHAFSSLPFGYGTRSCVGKRIATLAMNLALTGILQKFRVEPIEGMELTPYLRTLLATGPTIPVRFVDRS